MKGSSAPSAGRYLRNTVPGVIADTDEVLPGVSVDYDRAGRVVAMDLSAADLAVHFLDTQAADESRHKALAVRAELDTEQDALSIFFCDAETFMAHASEDDRLCLLYDKDMHVIGIKLVSALASIFGANPS